MINACLFAGGPYTSDNIIKMLKDKNVTHDQQETALMVMNDFFSQKVGTNNESKITQEELDQIFEIAGIALQETITTDVPSTDNPYAHYGQTMTVDQAIECIKNEIDDVGKQEQAIIEMITCISGKPDQNSIDTSVVINIISRNQPEQLIPSGYTPKTLEEAVIEQPDFQKNILEQIELQNALEEIERSEKAENQQQEESNSDSEEGSDEEEITLIDRRWISEETSDSDSGEESDEESGSSEEEPLTEEEKLQELRARRLARFQKVTSTTSNNND